MLKYAARESDGFFNGFVGVDGEDDVSARMFHLDDKRCFFGFVLITRYLIAVAVEQADVAIVGCCEGD